LRGKSRKLRHHKLSRFERDIGNEITTSDPHAQESGLGVMVTCAGIVVADIFAADLPKISAPGEVTFAPQGIEMHVGGHSANVSINLRQMGLAEGRVSSVGAVGDDLFGKFIESTLKSHGVVTHLQMVHETGSCKDLVLVVKGEDRRYHVDAGASSYLSPDNVRSVVAKERPMIFYVGATGMLAKFDEKLAYILRTAKGYDCLTFIDPVVPHKGEWGFLFPALKWIDIFHCNDTEASGITGQKDPRKAARVLIKEGVKLAIISMGERGVLAQTSRVTLEMPALKVPVIDPSGAGDAFCSGTIYKLVKKASGTQLDVSGLSVEDLTNIFLEGAAAGAACVTAIGTTTAVTRENVDRLLDEHGLEILKSTSVTTTRTG
jgi:sugar/nucleoside kinase (ribokinase family)